MGLKIALFFVLVGIFAKDLQKRIWPWGYAMPWHDRPSYALVDESNDLLMSKHRRLTKIYERLNEDETPKLNGPETIVFDNDGIMHALTEDGFLVKLTDFQEEEQTDYFTKVMKATVETVSDLGMGRPLGGKFDSDNTLYIADAHLGLTRLRENHKVELLASRVFDQGNWTQILYANDVAIGPETGMVYFTDSTVIEPLRVGTHTYDTMYGAKSEALKVSKTGRLLRYDPKTDTVKVLARGLHFPNGIAVDNSEQYVVFAETFALRMLKYSLKDEVVEVVVDEGLTGYPDGVDCAWKGATSKSGSCYAVMPSAMTPLLKKVMAIGHPLDMIVRTLLMGLPKSLAPPVKTYGGLVEINMDGAKNTFQIIQDPFGSDIGMLTGVTVHNDKLYLGSLKNEFIGVYQL